MNILVFGKKINNKNFNYPEFGVIELKSLTKSHNRFLIVDENTVYHFGASLKDLGKKWFAFSKMKMNANEMLTRLKEGEHE